MGTSQAEYVRFIDIEYFFRPIYAINNVCYLRVYNIYPNRIHFYFRPPRHYLTYRGGHCRAHFGGVSYYRRNYPARYHHPVYSRPSPSQSADATARLAGPRPGNRPPQKPNWKPAPRPDRKPVSVDRPNYRPLSIRNTNRRHAHLTILTRTQASGLRKDQPDARR